MFCQRSSGSRSQKRFLEVDRFKARPEDHQEDRPPARVLVLGVSLRRSAGGPRPCADPSTSRSLMNAMTSAHVAELPEERISSLKIPKQPLVLIGLKFLFESFTIPIPRGAHDAWPFRPGVLRLLLANQGVKRLVV